MKSSKSYDKLYSKIEATYNDAAKKDVKIETSISVKLIRELLTKYKFSDADKLYDVINDRQAYCTAVSRAMEDMWAVNDEKAINRMVSCQHLCDVTASESPAFFKKRISNSDIPGIEDFYKRADRTFGQPAKASLDKAVESRVSELCGYSKGFDAITGFLKSVKESEIRTIAAMHPSLKASKRQEILNCACDELNVIMARTDNNVLAITAVYDKYCKDWDISSEGAFIKHVGSALSTKTFNDIVEMYANTDCVRNYNGDLNTEIDLQIKDFVVKYTDKAFSECKNISEMNDAVSRIRDSDFNQFVTESVIEMYDSYADDILFNTEEMAVLNSEMQLIANSQLMGEHFDNSRASYNKAVKKKMDITSLDDFESMESIHSSIVANFTYSDSLIPDIEYRYTLSLMYHVSKTLDDNADANIVELLEKATSTDRNLCRIKELVMMYTSSSAWELPAYQRFYQMSNDINREKHGYQSDELPLIDKYYTKIIARTNVHRSENFVKDVLAYMSKEAQPGSLLLRKIDKLLYNIEFFEPTSELIDIQSSPLQPEYSELIEVLSAYTQWSNDGENPKHLLDLCDNVFNNCTRDLDLSLAYAIAGAVNESDCSWTYALNNYVEAAKHDRTGKGYIDKCAEVCIKASNKDAALKYTSESDTVISKLYAVEAEMITNNRVRNKIQAVSPNDNYTNAYKSLLSGNTEHALGVDDKALDFYNDGLTYIEENLTVHGRILCARILLGHGRAQAILDRDRIYLSNADFEKAIDLLSVFPASRRDIRMLIDEIERTKDRINNKTERGEQVTAKNDSSSLNEILEIPGFQTILITGEAISVGGRYKVYVGKGSNDSKQYAVRIHKNINPYRSATIPLSGDELKAMKAETEIWELLSDECPEKIVSLVGHANIKYPVQVMEWADNSFDNAISGLSTRDSKEVVITVLEELQAIHDCDVIHNDVKPENILQVGKYWKLSDFDTSFFVGDKCDNCRATYQYKSPEHFEGKEITTKSDVWAAGVMAYYVLTRGNYPFDGGETQYENNVCDGNYRAGALESKFTPLFDRVFSVDPEERPTAKEFADELRKLI